MRTVSPTSISTLLSPTIPLRMRVLLDACRIKSNNLKSNGPSSWTSVLRFCFNFSAGCCGFRIGVAFRSGTGFSSLRLLRYARTSSMLLETGRGVGRTERARCIEPSEVCCMDTAGPEGGTEPEGLWRGDWSLVDPVSSPPGCSSSFVSARCAGSLTCLTRGRELDATCDP